MSGPGIAIDPLCACAPMKYRLTYIFGTMVHSESFSKDKTLGQS